MYIQSCKRCRERSPTKRASKWGVDTGIADSDARIQTRITEHCRPRTPLSSRKDINLTAYSANGASDETCEPPVLIIDRSLFIETTWAQRHHLSYCNLLLAALYTSMFSRHHRDFSPSLCLSFAATSSRKWPPLLHPLALRLGPSRAATRKKTRPIPLLRFATRRRYLPAMTQKRSSSTTARLSHLAAAASSVS
jgi:hypothetical protein